MTEVETIKAVQRMQEFIETNLSRKITLKQLAVAAGYSPWHAARIFKEITGKAPFEYIRSMRLTKAALLLRDGHERVLDVALEFLFDSQEGFTRAFAREFGLAPGKYGRSTPPIRLFMPQKVFDAYRAVEGGRGTMKEDKKTKSVFVQVVERPARKVLLKRGIRATEYFAYCEEVGCDVWSVLSSVKEALYEPVGMWLPDSLVREGTSRYVQGVEVPLDYGNKVPEGYELIELPPCRVMVFQGEPFEDEDFMAAIDEVWRHIEGFDPGLYGYAWDPQAAPRFQLSPMGYRGYIEARPVKALE